MALRTVYDRITPSEMARYTGENPWWGVGYLLAQNYNRNYDQRGIEKATKAGSQALEKAKAAIDGTDYAGANAALDKISDRYMASGNAMQGYEQMQGLPQSAGQKINQMAQQAPQYEQMQGITPQRQPITPDYSFNGDEFKAKYIKEQQALGRPEHQIQQALAVMEPQIKNLDERARNERANKAIQQLAGLAPDLDNSERLKLINSLLKDSPELGKAFLADSITNRDKWQAKRQDEMADKATNRALALKATGGVFRSGNGRSSNGGGGRNGTGGKNYGAYNGNQGNFGDLYKKSKELYEYGGLLMDSQNPEIQKQGKELQTQAVMMMGLTPQEQDTDWNSYDSVLAHAQEAIKNNHSVQDVLAVAKKHISNPDIYNQLEVALIGKKPAGVLNIQPKQPTEGNDSKFFDDWYVDGQGRTGQAARSGIDVLKSIFGVDEIGDVADYARKHGAKQ